MCSSLYCSYIKKKFHNFSFISHICTYINMKYFFSVSDYRKMIIMIKCSKCNVFLYFIFLLFFSALSWYYFGLLHLTHLLRSLLLAWNIYFFREFVLHPAKCTYLYVYNISNIKHTRRKRDILKIFIYGHRYLVRW